MNVVTDLTRLSKQIAKAERDLIEVRGNSDVDEDDGLALLFTGQWQDSFPRELTLNRILSANEKVTWQAIRLSIDNPTRPGALPRRDELASMINCSAATVTTARAMLRACRWLTFCKSVRVKGRFVGDIYLFHDQPLSLEATLSIDSTYIPFLQNSVEGGSKRMRSIAGSILREIDSLQHLNPPTEVDLITDRLVSALDSETHRSKNFVPVKRQENNTKSVHSQQESREDKHREQIFATGSNPNNTEESDPSKNFATVKEDEFFEPTEEKNFFPSRARGSNNNINNNKYISTAQAREESGEQPVDDSMSASNDPELIPAKKSAPTNFNPNPTLDPEKTFTLAIDSFPELASRHVKPYVIQLFALREYNIPVIHRIIQQAPEQDRENIIFQLVGRQAALQHGWVLKPLNNLIAFVRELVNRAHSGDFNPDDWALALRNASATDEEPVFFDSPELVARKRRMLVES